MGLDKFQEKAVVRIIDDDDSMRKSWRFLIEGEGWTTKCYSSALRFLEEDDRNELGCVVLDVRMPDMSGIELQRVMISLFPVTETLIWLYRPSKTVQQTFFRNRSAPIAF